MKLLPPLALKLPLGLINLTLEAIKDSFIIPNKNGKVFSLISMFLIHTSFFLTLNKDINFLDINIYTESDIQMTCNMNYTFLLENISEIRRT